MLFPSNLQCLFILSIRKRSMFFLQKSIWVGHRRHWFCIYVFPCLFTLFFCSDLSLNLLYSFNFSSIKIHLSKLRIKFIQNTKTTTQTKSKRQISKKNMELFSFVQQIRPNLIYNIMIDFFNLIFPSLLLVLI